MNLIQQFRSLNSGIQFSLWWQLGLFLPSLLALPFDRRKILGLNPWIKPLKFEISVAIFLLTIGFVMRQLNSSPKAVNLIGWIIGIAMILENTLIVFQSARGVRSHMNYTSAFDGVIFSFMGVGIGVNTLALAALLLLSFRPAADWTWPAPVVLATRLGLAVLIWGSLEGVAIVNNKQHTVGAPDGGDGLPFVNWSTTHGDLRIAHFFALHALQAFLLLGFLISRTSLPKSLQSGSVIAFAVLYLAGCWWLYREAVAGRSPVTMWTAAAIRTLPPSSNFANSAASASLAPRTAGSPASASSSPNEPYAASANAAASAAGSPPPTGNVPRQSST